jgi:hypothetical protein
MSDAGDVHDPSNRRPCPDEMCTGILGPDGRCGTCGRTAGNGADPPAVDRGDDEPCDCGHEHDGGDDEPCDCGHEHDGGDDEPCDCGHEHDGGGEDDGPVEPLGDPARVRVPCGDDMCTGILGADGRCGTCGRTGRRSSRG